MRVKTYSIFELSFPRQYTECWNPTFWQKENRAQSSGCADLFKLKMQTPFLAECDWPLEIQTAKAMAIRLLMSFSQNFSRGQVVPWWCLISRSNWVSVWGCICRRSHLIFVTCFDLQSGSTIWAKFKSVVSVLQVLQCYHFADVGSSRRQAGDLAGCPHSLYKLHFHSCGSLACWKDGSPETHTWQLNRWVLREWIG